MSSKIEALFCRFALLNVVVFMIGFLSNLEGGFQKSWAFPIAKVGRLKSHLALQNSLCFAAVGLEMSLQQHLLVAFRSQ